MFMQNRSKGLAVFQIALTVIGVAAFAVFSIIFGSNVSSIASSEPGKTIAALLILLPFQIICTCFCALIGIIGTIIAVKERVTAKDGFSLAMLIINIVFVILPILMDVLTFVIANTLNG